MTLKIDGNMKVKTLKEAFYKEFGLTLRVYYEDECFADDESALAYVGYIDEKDDALSLRKEMTIGSVEQTLMELYDIKTRVAGSDDSYLCNRDKTLAEALEEDKKVSGQSKMQTDKTKNTKRIELSCDDDGVQKRYFVVGVVGWGGEYTAGTVSDSKEIDFLLKRAASGEFDLENENPDYDKNDKDSIELVPCYERDDILHSYGIDIEEDFCIYIKEMKNKTIYEDDREYISEENIENGSDKRCGFINFYNPDRFVDGVKENTLIVTSIVYDKGMTMEYLIEMTSDKFGCLIFATTLMDEIMYGFGDDVIDNVYYVEQESLRKFLYDRFETAEGKDKEAYKEAIEEYNTLEFDDENICNHIAFLMKELLLSLLNNRNMDSRQYTREMKWVFEPFMPKEWDIHPGRLKDIIVGLMNLKGERLDTDDY